MDVDVTIVPLGKGNKLMARPIEITDEEYDKLAVNSKSSKTKRQSVVNAILERENNMKKKGNK
jgi:hypothetical protein